MLHARPTRDGVVIQWPGAELHYEMIMRQSISEKPSLGGPPWGVHLDVAILDSRRRAAEDSFIFSLTPIPATV